MLSFGGRAELFGASQGAAGFDEELLLVVQNVPDLVVGPVDLRLDGYLQVFLLDFSELLQVGRVALQRDLLEAGPVRPRIGLFGRARVGRTGSLIRQKRAKVLLGLLLAQQMQTKQLIHQGLDPQRQLGQAHLGRGLLEGPLGCLVGGVRVRVQVRQDVGRLVEAEDEALRVDEANALGDLEPGQFTF